VPHTCSSISHASMHAKSLLATPLSMLLLLLLLLVMLQTQD
jgi:hypothetical protein